MIGPSGIQLSGQNGNDQFINIAVPLNGFKIQISSDGGAVSSSVVNVPMMETPNYRVDASSVGIVTQETGPTGNVGRYPQMHSNLGFSADTSVNRQVDPTFTPQPQIQNSPQTFLPANTPANLARTFVPVNPTTVPQVQSMSTLKYTFSRRFSHSTALHTSLLSIFFFFFFFFVF